MGIVSFMDMYLFMETYSVSISFLAIYFYSTLVLPDFSLLIE